MYKKVFNNGVERLAERRKSLIDAIKQLIVMYIQEQDESLTEEKINELIK